MVIDIITIAILTSCSSPSNKKETIQEFDIPSFFKKEAQYLNSVKPSVKKTVEKDGISETKDLIIADWDRELANFLSVDLNKSAYEGFLIKDSSENNVKYTFSDSTLDLTSIQIFYIANRPSSFLIKKSTKNLLYQTDETLEYTKDQSYSIDKKQKVKGLAEQHYKITGVIAMEH